MNPLQLFKSEMKFKKFTIAIIIFEVLIGSVIALFSTIYIESKRETEFKSELDSFINQRWKSQNSIAIKYAWWTEGWKEPGYKKESRTLDKFNKDSIFVKDYYYTGVFFDRQKPFIQIFGERNINKESPEIELIDHLFKINENSCESKHTFSKFKSNYYFITSISLCNDAGEPIKNGILILAYSLSDFHSAVESLFPLNISFSENADFNGFFYSYINLGEKDSFQNKQFYFGFQPRNLLFLTILVTLGSFVLLQIIIIGSVFTFISPFFTEENEKVKHYEGKLKSSEEINYELNKKIEELARTRVQYSNSEKKYKQLFENSNDIIFTLNSNHQITMVNKKIKDVIGKDPKELIGKSFLELIYEANEKSKGGLKIERKIIEEKLFKLREERIVNGMPTEFTTEFNEPRELILDFEYVEQEEDHLILCKAHNAIEDSLLKFCKEESKVYIFGNYLTVAEQISHRIIMNLILYASPDTVAEIKLALREIVINAIEHGNLNITFEEKTRVTTRGNYFEFVQERQKSPRYKDKKITLHYSLTPKKVSYTIKDEGMGFDHKRMINSASITANSLGLGHGRGIALAMEAFDIVRYNSKGNSVYLCKKFK